MWQIKMLKDSAKSLLPFQQGLRRVKRRLRPYTYDEDNSRLALSQGLHQIKLLRMAGVDLTGDVLEIGSGWIPIVSLLFHVAGARRVVLTDIEKLIDDQTIAAAKDMLRSNLTTVTQELLLPTEVAVQRVNRFQFEYSVPWRIENVADSSVDVIISRAVFEHVRPEQLEQFVRHSSRILRTGGAMCHIVDNSDHWEHHDKHLSRVNFLRYEDGWFWRMACFNPQNYQNRLRHGDYINLFRRCGWEAVGVEGEPDAQALKDLAVLPLARRFRGRDHRDLAILTSTFVLRRTQC